MKLITNIYCSVGTVREVQFASSLLHNTYLFLIFSKLAAFQTSFSLTFPWGQSKKFAKFQFLW